jgi:hypothetical protein
MHEIKFNAKPDEADTIAQIVDRALNTAQKLPGRRPGFRPIDLTMALTATHCNGTPLKLAELLAAPDFDFSHDVFGIMRHIDRATGQLGDCFLPRFAQPEAA